MKAQRVFPCADAHCDFLYGMQNYGYDIRSCTGNQTMSLERMQKGNVKLQLFAAWVDMLLKVNPLSQCLGMIDAYYRMLEANPVFVPFTKGFDPNGEKIATLLTVEGGEAIEGSVENLRMLYKLGVRAMTLTWNDVNSLAYPATKKSRHGLSALGREVVKEMCRIGMAVDLAHLGDAGIDDVLETATRPVFASHTNARSVHNHPRCMQDAHIKAIADMGGVIGINFYYKQLVNEKHCSIHDVLRHIEHVINIGGIDCCAIGSDYDGMNRCPVGLEDSSKLQGLAAGLSELGLSDEDIDKVMYRNMANYVGKFTD